ncbi:MAG: baseplate J/gp47 family protein [Hyphomicrobiaceae bacterium]|nr:baseplate J/gp47 family protein [Hyphomicrobiaceae bacterium]
MSRFVAIDLSQLPAPKAITPVIYNELVAARKQALLERIADVDLRTELEAILTLESEPLVKDIEAGAYRETIVYQRINEAVKAVLLATSQGADLDNLVARLGVHRKIITPENQTAAPPIEAVLESDADLKYRYQLAPEAFSVAGPYGAYEFHARAAHAHVKDAAIYGPESGLVTPGQALTVILSREGTGVPTQAVIDSVLAKLSHEDTVPDTDEVLVEAATVIEYAIAYHLEIRRGADPSLIVAQAQAALEKYAVDSHQIARTITDSALDSAAHGDRVNVVRATRSQPVGEIDPGAKGAGWCTSVTITYGIVGE